MLVNVDDIIMIGTSDPTLKVLVNINEIIVSLFDKQYLNERDEMDLHMVFATLNDMIKRKSNSDDNIERDVDCNY
ncbi:MAG: hypothetical protein M0R51_12065 [Clostridia bacterium]|nr:hypothetical protein [Clostridia bacterium]